MINTFIVVVDERTEEDVARGAEPRPREVLAGNGDHSELVDYSNRKYTHHPVALLQELALSRLLRQVPLSELCALVLKYRQTRSPSWEPFYARGFPHLLRDVECDPVETARAILWRCQLTCLVCDAVSWDGMDDADSWGPAMERWDAVCLEQSSFRRGIDCKYFYVAPVFCPACHATARKRTKHLPFAREYDEIRVLTALNSMFKSNIPSRQRKRV
jgi:hypothetical protein